MSYILDALRRAEAERQRGAVPGLQDQPQPLSTPAAPPAADPRRTERLWVLACVGLLAAGGAAAWWWWKPPGPTPVAPVVTIVPVPPAAAPVQSAAAPAVVSSLPALATAPNPAAALAAPMLVLPPIPPQAIAPAAPAEPARKPAARPAVPATPAASTVPTAPLVPAPDAVRRQDLPENVRQQLPALAVAGATYSENPRYRMVIINGQVVQEGDAAAPGVVLETIRPKEVVLRAQGYRFTEKY